ncbi:MAG: radical SAM/SPASM domain-containing protein [Planctomycetota bacterium]
MSGHDPRPRFRGPRSGGGGVATALAWLIARLYLRRPELAEVIALRYRSLWALLGGVANEVAYRRGRLRAPSLLSLNLELTNRCNLRCRMCPTGNGRMRRPRGDMDPRLFRRVLQRSRPLEFLLLFQWGEPLLHPRLPLLLREARRSGARTLLTTNGTLLDDRRIGTVLDAKVDRVTVSIDGDGATHARMRGIPLEETEAGLRRLVEARDARRSRTAVDVSMVVGPDTEEAAASFAVRYRGWADRVQRIPLLTQGRRRTRCREPWRGGLVVLQDGRVSACCVDHDGELVVGDAREEDPRTIWNGPRMRALRRAHVEGDLPALCARCTEYPSDAAAPRFSSRAEASTVVPEAPHAAPPRRGAVAGWV